MTLLGLLITRYIKSHGLHFIKLTHRRKKLENRKLSNLLKHLALRPHPIRPTYNFSAYKISIKP